MKPRIILIVGIAGARPEKEFTLGDVIVANRMYNFSVTAANADGTVEYAIRGAPAHRFAEVIAANLTADASKYDGWQSDAAIGITRPPVSLAAKNIRGDTEWRKKVRDSLLHHFGKHSTPRGPIVTDGAIGSSSTLMKDPKLFTEWLNKAREVRAVDMEISGAFEAARSVAGDIPTIVIRGISDIVGFKRESRWTDYACHSAASFSFKLIISGVLNPNTRTRSGVISRPRHESDDLNTRNSTSAPVEENETPFRSGMKEVERWLLKLLEMPPETRPLLSLEDIRGRVLAVLLTWAEYELLRAAAAIARNPQLWESLRQAPVGETLSLEEAFAPEEDGNARSTA